MSAARFPLSWPEGWPRIPDARRAPSRFRTRYLDAYDNLMKELNLLGATGVIISSNAPLRRDGKPYSDAMTDDLEDPGVACYFTLNGEPRVMARDGHPIPAENLHAIGHVIGHLRGLERHGGSYMMSRAFAGFAALPAPGGARKRPWREVFEWPDGMGVGKGEIEVVYRAFAKERHPDKPGGSAEAMAELNRAREEALKEISND